jgi:hypothetical protein
MILYSPRLILSQIIFNKVKNRPVCSSDKNKNKIRFEIQNVHIFVNMYQYWLHIVHLMHIFCIYLQWCYWSSDSSLMSSEHLWIILWREQPIFRWVSLMLHAYRSISRYQLYFLMVWRPIIYKHNREMGEYVGQAE